MTWCFIWRDDALPLRKQKKGSPTLSSVRMRKSTRRRNSCLPAFSLHSAKNAMMLWPALNASRSGNRSYARKSVLNWRTCERSRIHPIRTRPRPTSSRIKMPGIPVFLTSAGPQSLLCARCHLRLNVDYLGSPALFSRNWIELDLLRNPTFLLKIDIRPLLAGIPPRQGRNGRMNHNRKAGDARRSEKLEQSVRPPLSIADRGSRGFGRGIDHLSYCSDLRRRKPADRSMLADNRLIFGKIHTERLIVSDVTLDPLNIRAKLTQDPVGFCGCSPQLFTFERTHLGNVTLDDELL